MTVQGYEGSDRVANVLENDSSIAWCGDRGYGCTCDAVGDPKGHLFRVLLGSYLNGVGNACGGEASHNMNMKSRAPSRHAFFQAFQAFQVMQLVELHVSTESTGHVAEVKGVLPRRKAFILALS